MYLAKAHESCKRLWTYVEDTKGYCKCYKNDSEKTRGVNINVVIKYKWCCTHDAEIGRKVRINCWG